MIAVYLEYLKLDGVMYKNGRMAMDNKSGHVWVNPGTMKKGFRCLGAKKVDEIAGYRLFKLECITADGEVTLTTNEDIRRLIVFKCDMDYEPKQVQYFLQQLPLINEEE